MDTLQTGELVGGLERYESGSLARGALSADQAAPTRSSSQTALRVVLAR